MSEENVEVVRQVIDAWSRNEEDKVLRFFKPDIVFDATRRVLNPKTYVGIEGIADMLTDRNEVWDEFRTEPSEFIDAGDRVLLFGHWVGKGKGSGIEVEQPVAHVFTLYDPGIDRVELAYTDRAETLEAVGLRE